MISLDGMAPLAVVGLLSLCWIAIGIGTGWVGNRVNLDRLDHDTWLTRARAFEDGGRFYDRTLRIRLWKDRLPERGDTFRDGFSKSHLTGRSEAHLERFIAETRRAEYVHWANVAASVVFAVFLPRWIVVVMVPFGLVVHLPFVAIQRYNRARLQRTVARRRLRATRRAKSALDLGSTDALGYRLPT
ncbi:MAG: hypothetical protein ACR2OH_11035 [Microthrixaceae bacterium]